MYFIYWLNISKKKKNTMATWTPSQLTNPAFVANLPPSDRNDALAASERQLEIAQNKLEGNRATEQALNEQLTSGPASRQALNEARKKAQEAATDPNIPNEQKAALDREYQDLRAQREQLLDQRDIASRNAMQAEASVQLSQQGIDSLRTVNSTGGNDITSKPPPPPEDTPVPDNTPSSDTAQNASADTLGVDNNTGDDYNVGQSEDPLDGVEKGYRESPVPPGAQPPEELPPKVTVNSTADIKRNISKKPDLRVTILVPQSYLTPFTIGTSGINQLKKIGGILFPYTPSISFENKADYSEQKPLHTNYALSFYQRSYVTDISIQGDFTVESPEDAEVYLSTMHLLKALTKMRFGTDPDAGAAPPVCRLYAYGPMMLENVPVSISSYRIELPKDVDYYPIEDARIYGPTMVPAKSVVSINCKIMYSRQELQNFSVTRYLNGAFIGKGLI